jgi:hypothetical protein
VNKVHGIMGITKKKRASAPLYISPNQLSLEGFQTPFEQKLSKDSIWFRRYQGKTQRYQRILDCLHLFGA